MSSSPTSPPKKKNPWVKDLGEGRVRGITCRPVAPFRVAVGGWVRMEEEGEGEKEEVEGGSHTSQGDCELISTLERERGGGREGGRESEKKKKGER